MLKIPASNYKIMPWKNGHGITAEIDREPKGDGPFLWRLSQATIQTDGPFSLFPGYDRWLAVWKGDSIFLNGLKVPQLEPVCFSGDENTYCRLTARPVQDVGLIFDRTKVQAKMSVVEGLIHLPPSHAHYLFDLKSGDTMKLNHAADLAVSRSFLISVRSC